MSRYMGALTRKTAQFLPSQERVPFREAVNVRKAFRNLKFKISRTRSMTQANDFRGGQIMIARSEPNPVAELRQFLPWAHQSAVLRGLNSRLDDIIHFRSK